MKNKILLAIYIVTLTTIMSVSNIKAFAEENNTSEVEFIQSIDEYKPEVLEELTPSITETTETAPDTSENIIDLTGENNLESFGVFKITAYAPYKGANITSRGHKLVPYRTVAVDPRVIPYGTILLINGQEWLADDCGGAIKGNRLDICLGSRREALNFGVEKAEVFRVVK